MVDLSTITQASSAAQPVTIVRKDSASSPFASLPAIVLIALLAVGNIVLVVVVLAR